MNKQEEASKIFDEGLNCAQSVISVFSKELGIDRNTALKIACGFGGGFGRAGEICGAVSGAVMALGLKYGNDYSKDQDKKYYTYEKVNQFIKLFKEKNSSIHCRDLLGADLSTEQGRVDAKEKNLFNTLCPKFVKDAVKIVEKIL